VLNLLLLLVVGLSLGLSTMPVHAMPCPGHDEVPIATMTGEHTHSSHAEEPAGHGHAHASMPSESSDQAGLDDMACCHVVVVHTPAVETAPGVIFVLEPSGLPRDWLPPLAALGNSIFRPPSV
jgi:hypothetical protein